MICYILKSIVCYCTNLGVLYGLGGRFESFRFTEQKLPSCELLETGGLIGCCVK